MDGGILMAIDLEEMRPEYEAAELMTPEIPIGPDWPKQTLFCGHLVGVKWGDGGGAYASPDDDLDLDAIDVAIGRTQSEAMASLISTKQGGSNRKNLEEALTALGLGILDSIDEPDGDLVLDYAVHRQSFMAKGGGVLDGKKISPSGYRVDGPDQSGTQLIIDSGKDIISQNQLLTIEGVVGVYTVDSPVVSALDGSNVTEIIVSPPLESTAPDDAVISFVEDIEFAAPNFYEPKELNLVISNIRRSTRYGEDGIYDEDGLLLCRVSLGTSPFDSYSGPWGSYQIQGLPNNASIPDEIHALNRTCFYFGLAKFGNSNHADILKDFANGITIEEILSISSAADDDDWKAFEQIALNQKNLAEFYINPCLIYLRSPLAINTWTQAWVPIFMDYTIELHPLVQSDWSLGDIDFNLEVNDVQNSLSNNPEVYLGRNFLYGKSGAIMAQQLDLLIKQLDNLNDKADVPIDTTGLSEMKATMAVLDVLSSSILHDELELSELSPSLLDSAIVDIVKISVVDIFGQVVSLTKGSSSADLNPSVSLSLETEDDSRYALLRPRFSTSARLNLTMLDVQDDGTRADPSRTPMIGFLLPDHLEWALEVFDSLGGPLGQLSVAERDWSLDGYQTGRVNWDPAPGSEIELGTPPETGNSHLDLMLNELIRISLDDEIDFQEKQRSGASLSSTEEGALSALMRGIDTIL